jgi:hypothetical protein
VAVGAAKQLLVFDEIAGVYVHGSGGGVGFRDIVFVGAKATSGCVGGESFGGRAGTAATATRDDGNPRVVGWRWDVGGRHPQQWWQERSSKGKHPQNRCGGGEWSGRESGCTRAAGSSDCSIGRGVGGRSVKRCKRWEVGTEATGVRGVRDLSRAVGYSGGKADSWCDDGDSRRSKLWQQRGWWWQRGWSRKRSGLRRSNKGFEGRAIEEDVGNGA